MFTNAVVILSERSEPKDPGTDLTVVAIVMRRSFDSLRSLRMTGRVLICSLIPWLKPGICKKVRKRT